jgi:hypothetical protein
MIDMTDVPHPLSISATFKPVLKGTSI